MKTDKDKLLLVETNDEFDPPLKTIKKNCTDHSILSIKEKMNNNAVSFHNVTYGETLNEISNLVISKSPTIRGYSIYDH